MEKPLAGKALYLSRNVPSRTSYVKKAESLGGQVVFDERKADIWIADPKKPGAPKQALNYTYLDAMKEDHKVVRWQDYLIHAGTALSDETKGTSAVSPKMPKQRRAAFTIEESKMIWDYMAEHERRKTGVANNLHFKHLAEAMPSHTWQSVQDHYLKKLKPRWSDALYRQSVLSVNHPTQRSLDQANRKLAMSMSQLEPQQLGNVFRSPMPGQMQWNQAASVPMYGTQAQRGQSSPANSMQRGQPVSEWQKTGQKKRTAARVKFSDPVSSDLGPSSPVKEHGDSDLDAEDEEADAENKNAADEQEEVILPSSQQKRLSELEAELAPAKRQKVEKSDDAEVPNTPDMSPVKERSGPDPVSTPIRAEHTLPILSPRIEEDLPAPRSPLVTASAEKAVKIFRDVSARLSDPFPSSPPAVLTPISEYPPVSSHLSTEPEVRRFSQIIEKAVTQGATPPSSPPVAVTSTMPDLQAGIGGTPESPEPASAFSPILDGGMKTTALSKVFNGPTEELSQESTEPKDEIEMPFQSQFESQFIPDVTMPDPDFEIEDLPLAVPDPDIDMSDAMQPDAQSSDRPEESSEYPSDSRSKQPPSKKVQPQNTSADDAAELDAWIDHQISKGSAESDVISALKATSMDIPLAKIALVAITAGKGLPDSVPGIWTKEDDLALQGSSAKVLRQLERKHGTEHFRERMKFWGEYGTL